MDMARNAILAALAAFLPVLAVAQTAPAHLEFEVASIRPAPPIEGKVDIGMHIDGAQVRFSFLSLREYARIAWQLKDFQVVGPDWVSSDRYNIVAKIPPGSSQDQIHEMLKNLLVDRFKMTFHNEKREFPVYALIQTKAGIKLKETPPDSSTDGADATPKPGLNISASGSAAGVFVDLGGGSYYTFADNHLIGHKLTMERVADVMSRYLDKPIIDLTGLSPTTLYEINLEITHDDYMIMLIRAALKSGVSLPPQAAQMAEATPESLFSAMEAAGLKLDSRKAPVDALVIDRADKTPTEN
jgi:uncharacterized protein (TIGR03435 family)